MTEPTQTLTGNVALITGAARRLGKGMAQALAVRGADVVIHYRHSEEEALETVQAVETIGRKAWTVQGDLLDSARAAALVDEAARAAGKPIDILINSASVFKSNLITTVSATEIMENIQLHAIAALLLSRALAAQTRRGRIINMVDARMADYDREHAAYHISKRMLFTITQMLALELAPAVRVNSIAPGAILPAESQTREQFEQLAQSVPLRRVGSVEDIVAAVLFLLESPFITGQVIFVDGGRHMRGSMYGA